METNIERAKYTCGHCRYEFTRKADVEFKHCPYCGRQNTIEMRKGNYASKLLSEVSKYNL